MSKKSEWKYNRDNKSPEKIERLDLKNNRAKLYVMLN